MKNAKLYSLSGPDCSGKSTQIALLERHLVGQGHRVEVFWFRPGYSRLMVEAKAGLRRLRPSALPRHDQHKARQEVFSKPGVSKTWVAGALVDTLIHYAAYLRLQRLRGVTVICDRYLDDALLDLELNFPALETPQWRSVKALRLVCPKPDRAFLLQLDMAEVNKRMASKEEPFPDPPEIRSQRHARYEILAQGSHYRAIDALQPIDKVHHAILKEL